AVRRGPDGGARLGAVSHGRGYWLERVTLDGEDGEVGGSECLHPVRRGHPGRERTLGRPDLEAALAQRGERRSAGEARDLVAGARQLSAVVGAHRPGAQAADFHAVTRLL